MGSVKVDEIGVSVDQKERPNGLSVGSRSAIDKLKEGCSTLHPGQDKNRIANFTDRIVVVARRRPDRRLIVNPESVAGNWN